MKKSLYFALAASFLFAACDEDYTDWADPQSSTEGAATVVSGSVTTAGSINGASAAGSVALLNLSAPEGCSISAAHIYVNGEKISFDNQNGQILVDADELAALVKSSYNSLAATTRALSVTGKFGMVNPQGEASPINVDPVTVNYTAKPLPANASEGEYWYVGGHNGWNLSLDNPDKFEDKGNGIYQLTIQIGDGEWFSFAPKSAVEAGDWNGLFRAPSNGFAENRGFLDNDPTTGFSFCCETGGNYTFTLDMVNYTWSYVNYIEPAYYYIGALGTDKSYPLTNGGVDPLVNPVFTATIPAAGGWHWFKIAPESGFNEDGSWNWDNEQYCACAPTKDDESMSGKFVIGGDKYSWHILEDEYPAKFYRLSFNFMTQEYSITPVNFE